ncbi:MAG: hypothetical protein S4CHLAM6_14780 [Chlamydiae bacterium]|nr:hypothetical protein [Chlamydiota bacterium]
MDNPFTKHPHEVGESYFKHLLEALYLFARLTYSGSVMLIHAFIPFLFTKTASNTIFYFHKRFTERLNSLETTEKEEDSSESEAILTEE